MCEAFPMISCILKWGSSIGLPNCKCANNFLLIQQCEKCKQFPIMMLRTVLSHAFWPPVSRIWHTLAVLFCWWMAEIGSCIFCLAQYSANQAKKHSQGMPNAWDRWPEASDSTVSHAVGILAVYHRLCYFAVIGQKIGLKQILSGAECDTRLWNIDPKMDKWLNFKKLHDLDLK